MAKRGTLDHPKVKRLGRALNSPAWAALGLLESVWHWVSRYKPEGQLTDCDFDDCADTIRYDDGGAALSAILHSCGLLDVIGDGAWYVHDWHDHADETTKKALEKAGKCFANGSGNRRYKKEQVQIEENEPIQLDDEQFANDSQLAHESNVTAKPSLAKPSLAKPSPRTEPPTIDEVRDHAKTIGMPQKDADACFYWYDARGWVTGPKGTPVVKWKSVVSGWHSRNKTQPPSSAPPPSRQDDGLDAWKSAPVGLLGEDL